MMAFTQPAYSLRSGGVDRAIIAGKTKTTMTIGATMNSHTTMRRSRRSRLIGSAFGTYASHRFLRL